MPLIEELPITQSHRATHGWAYVPDTFPAPIAAVQPGNRKRNRDQTAAATANATAKQRKATQSRLDALDKENYKDGVSVPIPPRSGEKKRDKKMTVNVRRILTSQRTFAHYLADEEAGGNAAPAATGGGVSGSGSGLVAQGVVAKVDGRRKAAVAALTAVTMSTSATPVSSTGMATSTPTVTPTPARRGRPPASVKRERERAKERELELQREREREKENEKTAVKEVDTDVVMTDDAPSNANAPTTSTTTTTTSAPAAPVVPKLNYDAKLDSHPLLRTTGLPKMPSDRVMAALRAESALSYTAARARPADDESPVPPRRFCAVCGYWGKVKCRKCGEWTCGILDCWRGHEGVCVAQGMF